MLSNPAEEKLPSMTTARPLPFGLRVLLVFLVAEAAKLAFEILSAAPALSEFGKPAVGRLAIHLLVAILLAMIVHLRMKAARYWAIVYFAMSLFLCAFTLADAAPEIWVGLGHTGRWLVVSSCVIDGAFIAYLIRTGPCLAFYERDRNERSVPDLR